MNAQLPIRRRVKFHRTVGRFGFMGSVGDERDRFGEVGSRGKTFCLAVWRNPRRLKAGT